MITLPIILAGAASALLLLLAAIHILRGKRSVQRSLFILSAVFVSAAMAALSLALASGTPEDVMLRLQYHISLMIFSPALLIPFFSFFGRDDAAGKLRRWLPGIVMLGIVLAAAAILVPVELVVERFQMAEGGGLWRVGVTSTGQILALLALAVNVLLLHKMENTYGASTIPAKVTLKYPLLGIVAASAMNFVMMSRTVILFEFDGFFISLGAIGIIFFGLSMLYAGWRYPVFEIRTTADRSRPQSVVSVVTAGLYLLALAIVKWISSLIGIPYGRFGVLVISAFAVFIVLAVFISGRARRRLKTFIGDYIRPGSYNYRREWRHYARLMTSGQTVQDLLSNTISSICDTMIVRKGMIFAEVGGGDPACIGLSDEERGEVSTAALMAVYDGTPTVRPVGKDIPRWVSAVSFLTIGGEARGFVALGRKEFGRAWSEEDSEFLGTITDQAALALENILMEERVLESKQLESFNRFVSFVIHDLKNTVGMLSLTAENAKDNIHDRDFQADAIDTVERSVQKMRRLIDSLNAHKAPAEVTKRPADAADAADAAVSSLEQLASRKGVSVFFQPAGSVEAVVDPAAISRIVENLVLNSIEALGEGGKIEVGVSRTGGTLTIAVSDNGPGFDREYLEDGLFRPFMSTKKNGLGVGLVLCKSLAEAHGGTIKVANAPRGGASVTVEIPAAR